MKKIFGLIIILSFFLCGVANLSSMNPVLMGKTIVIDVGHGGKDGGTSYKDIFEKDINLDIALKLKGLLLKNGVNVILTREGDYDLSSPNALRRKKSDFDNRIKLINDSDANMYISIHINYLDASKYYGAQVFYTKDNENIANNIQKSFVKILKSPLDYRKLSDDIYMYKKINVPGVLVECGFLSNPEEAALLNTKNYKEKIVNAIYSGVLLYFGNNDLSV